jgi:molecular chaperone GrpE
MTKQGKTTAAGQRDDGSFDLTDEAAISPEELAQQFECADTEAGAGADVPGEDPPPAAGGDAGELQTALDEAVAARQRAMADLVNFRRRADENEVRARHDGVLCVMRSLLPVLDHFELALEQNPDEMTIEQLMDGVRLVRDELHKALDGHELMVILPEPGEEFDPNMHQAVHCDETADQEPNTVVEVMQVGYTVGDTIVRPAMVSIAGAPGDQG